MKYARSERRKYPFALITKGAQDIGRGIALNLVAQGYSVVVAGWLKR